MTWGRAGVRLTDTEVAERRSRRASAAAQARTAHERRLDAAYALWRAGRLCPAAIRLHMDARGAEGPEVDAACLAEEPEVDEWELGLRYPSWEQTLALSAYLGVSVHALEQSPAHLGRVFICPPPPGPLDTGDDLFASPTSFETTAVHDAVRDSPHRRPTPTPSLTAL